MAAWTLHTCNKTMVLHGSKCIFEKLAEVHFSVYTSCTWLMIGHRMVQSFGFANISPSCSPKIKAKLISYPSFIFKSCIQYVMDGTTPAATHLRHNSLTTSNVRMYTWCFLWAISDRNSWENPVEVSNLWLDLRRLKAKKINQFSWN